MKNSNRENYPYLDRQLNKIAFITQLSGLLILLTCVAPTSLFARTEYQSPPVTITGQVVDESSNPLAGVTVTDAQIEQFKQRGDGDWKLENVMDNAPQQSHNVTISGGAANSTYLMSAGYFDQENMFIGPNYGNADRNTSLGAVKDRMKAEARFLRAFHYFRLTNWYGDVPLLTDIISVEESRLAKRNPKADVLKFVLDELDAATLALPKKEDYPAADRGRVTKAAAKALKARVLLYQGNRMAEVAAICEDLINNQGVNGTYNTQQASYASIFMANNEYNSEVIFDIPYIVNVRTYDEPSRMIPISAGAQNSENYNAPTKELVNSYIMLDGKAINDAGSGYDENNPYVNRDPRLTATLVYDKYVWTNANGTTTQVIYIKPGSDPNTSRLNEQGSGLHKPTGYYWRKYYDPTVVSNQSTKNLILLRRSEVLLMYAEAKNALGQMNAAVWDKTIKLIRARAGFTDPLALNYPGNSSITMTELIRNERRTELALESLRIDDIKRWKIAETVLNGWVHGAKWGPAAIDNGYIRVTERVFKPAKHYL